MAGPCERFASLEMFCGDRRYCLDREVLVLDQCPKLKALSTERTSRIETIIRASLNGRGTVGFSEPFNRVRGQGRPPLPEEILGSTGSRRAEAQRFLRTSTKAPHDVRLDDKPVRERKVEGHPLGLGCCFTDPRAVLAFEEPWAFLMETSQTSGRLLDHGVGSIASGPNLVIGVQTPHTIFIGTFG